MIDPEIRRIVELAIGAAGTATDHRRFAYKVNELVPAVAALLREPASGAEEDALVPYVTARKMTEARTFRCEFRDARYDESTKRIFVRVYDEKHSGSETDTLDEDGCQTVRTEPMWTTAGRVMRERIKALESGQQVVCWRYNEPLEGGRKKMGVLVHIEAVGSRPGGGSPQGVTTTHRPAPNKPPGPAPEERQVTPLPGANPSAADPDHVRLIAERFERLSGRQRVAFAHACRAAGLDRFMEPAPEQVDAVLVIMSRIEQNKEDTDG